MTAYDKVQVTVDIQVTDGRRGERPCRDVPIRHLGELGRQVIPEPSWHGLYCVLGAGAETGIDVWKVELHELHVDGVVTEIVLPVR
jgi:hypothetical protein